MTPENIKSEIMDLLKKYYAAVQPDKHKGDYVPVSGKVLGEEELLNMVDASMDMWLTTGRYNDEFEKKFAGYLGAKYVLTTNSGSSANLLAVSALTSSKLGDRALKAGDEVITVAAGFPTTVNPIIQNGLVPVFVDVELETCNINADLIEQALSPKTKAVFVAHTLGNVYDLDKIKGICEKHNLWLIEDSCDALGAKFKGKTVGTIGHIGTFSFYPAHHITMGEGGALCTNDPELYKIIMSFRDWGRDCWCKPGKDGTCGKRFSMKHGNMPEGYDHKYIYSHIGYNLKITDWQAAIGLAQLDKLDSFIEQRNNNFNYLYSKLKEYGEFFSLPFVHEKVRPSWFGLVLTVKGKAPFGKIELVRYLEENKIGTRQLFGGNLLRQPLFVDNDITLRIHDSTLLYSKSLTEKEYSLLPNTDTIMNSTFWIGVWPGLTTEDLDIIITTVKNFIDGYNGKKD